MTFEKVLNGVVRYLNSEIFSKMNDWQEIAARIAFSRLLGNTENLKRALVNNGFLRTFAIIDNDGNIDVDGLMRDLKAQVEAKGKLTISLPMFGNFTFTSADIDKLHRAIIEG
jgi:hypothetical protein